MKTLYGYVGRLGSGKAYCMMKQVELLKTTGNSVYLVSFADPIKQILKQSFGFTKEGKSKETTVVNKLEAKQAIVTNICTLINGLNIHKFNISQNDLEEYITKIYEKHEDEFFDYVWAATTGYSPATQTSMNYSFAFRRLGQMLGTEIGRSIHGTIWVDIAFAKVLTVFNQNLADYAFIDDCRFLNEYTAFLNFKEDTVFNVEVIGIKASDETRANRRKLSIEELKAQDEHDSEKEIDTIINMLPKSSVLDNN